MKDEFTDAEFEDAAALYEALQKMFATDDDINGGDLVEFIGTVIGNPGVYNIELLVKSYGLPPYDEEDE